MIDSPPSSTCIGGGSCMSIAWRLKIVKYYRNALSNGYAYDKPPGTGKEPEYQQKSRRPCPRGLPVTIDAGLAEGVYAASGAKNAVTLSELSTVANWGSDNGQLKFTADLSGVNLSQLTLVITFNQNISNAWGGGASVSVNGKTATATWYSAPTSAELNVQVNSGLSTLKIDSYSYHNS